MTMVLLTKGSLFVFLLLWDRVSSFALVGPSLDSSSKRKSVTQMSFVRTRAEVIDTKEDVLEEMGIHMPFGLRQTLLTNACQDVSKRFWIVDNSGSMAMLDGHRILALDGSAECSRWAEVQETVNCHAQLSATLGARTDFRLLNPPQKTKVLSLGLARNSSPQHRFQVGYGERSVKDTKRAQNIMARSHPAGMTPLPESIRQVRSEIIRMVPQLEADGSKVALIIATDGCNYNVDNIGPGSEEERNQEVKEALESLQGLPVSVVIRLCTDYEPLVDFYNDLDEELDLDLDVIDDHLAEAEEVYQHNPWLNYALVLHRMREMGQACRLFDILDERALTKREVRDFCGLLFGQTDLPSDWPSFLEEIERIEDKELMQWNPRTKKMAPWIDMGELASLIQ